MKILDNPVYIGKIAYGRSVTEKVKGSRDEYKRVRTDDYMLVDGMHEAIIDQETWEATRLRRNDTGIKWEKTHSLDHEHILSGPSNVRSAAQGLLAPCGDGRTRNPASTRMIFITSAYIGRRLMKRISATSDEVSGYARQVGYPV